MRSGMMTWRVFMVVITSGKKKKIKRAAGHLKPLLSDCVQVIPQRDKNKMEFEGWCSLNTKEAAGKAHGFLLSSALSVPLSFMWMGISPGDIVHLALKWQSDQGHSCGSHGFHISALERMGLVGVTFSCAYGVHCGPEVLKRRKVWNGRMKSLKSFVSLPQAVVMRSLPLG